MNDTKEMTADVYALLFVQVATLVILVFYAKDTHRIANQAQESNLRPIVLRGGFLKNWHVVKPLNVETSKSPIGEPIVFRIHKNIATDINGYIVLEKYKYSLVFFNEISAHRDGPIISNDKLSNLKEFSVSETWGWMQPESLIYTLPSELSREPSNAENHILLNYRDIEGNRYYTVENSTFNQKSFKENSLKRKADNLTKLIKNK